MPVTTQFGGADPTLVQAATRAGFASAPQDYSKTFQAVAESYHEMVTSNAEIWGKVMHAAGTKIADEMKAHTDSPEQTETLETWMSSESGAEFKNWFQENNDAIQATFKRDKRKMIDDKDNPGTQIANPNYNKGGLLSSMTKENKEIRAKLWKERTDRFADMQFQVDNLDAAKGFIDKGQVWGEATGIFGMEINNAAYATRRGRVTERGNYMVYEEGDDGKMKFTMYNDATKADSYDPQTNTIEDPFDPSGLKRIDLSVLGDDFYDKPGPVMRINSAGNEEKIRYNGKEILNMITLKPKEDSAGNSLLQKAMEKDFLSVLNLGGASKTGKLDGTTKNRVNGIAKKYSDNPAAWHTETWIGEDNNSFFKEATNASGLTANLFNAANQHIDWENIENQMENVAGTSPGIDEADFAGSGDIARRNLLGLQSALFNTGNKYYKKEQTAKVFEDWVDNKLDGVFTEGYNARIRKGDGGDAGGLGSITYAGMFVGGSKQNIPPEERKQITNVANKMDARETIGKGKSAITWDDARESYFQADGTVIATKQHLFEELFEETLTRIFKSSDFYTSIADWDGKKYLEKKKKKKSIKEKIKTWKDKPWTFF